MTGAVLDHKTRIKAEVKSRTPLIASTFFLVFTLFVFAPLEMYMGNISEFWFKTSQFWFVPTGLGVLAAIVILIVGFILHENAWQKYSAFIFGLGIAIYVQGNFLNLKLGRLDGTSPRWSDYSINFAVNAMIWAVLIIAPIVLISRLKAKAMKLISALACLLILTQGLALLMLALGTDWQARMAEGSYVSRNGIMELADNHNIVMFILDMYGNDGFELLLKQEPELQNKFDGFTMFDNFTSEYALTQYALPFILTGQRLYNEKPLAEMTSERFQKAMYWRELRENNYKYNIFSADIIIPEWMNENVGNIKKADRKFSSYMDFTMFLSRFVASKYLPNVIKPYVWLDGTELVAITDAANKDVYRGTNDEFKKEMAQTEMLINKEINQLSFIHIFGAHFPYSTDENGDYKKDATEQAAYRGALQLVLNYIDKMRALGKYDDTTIIITADHGHSTNEAKRQSAPMVIKPKNAKGTMRRSSVPVCQLDIIPTIMSEAGLNAEHRYGKSLFEYTLTDKRSRLYYQTMFKDTISRCDLIEYSIDDADNTPENMHKTNRVYSADGKMLLD